MPQREGSREVSDRLAHNALDHPIGCFTWELHIYLAVFIGGNDKVNGLSLVRFDHVNFSLSDIIIVEGDLGDILKHPAPGLLQDGLHSVMSAVVFGGVGRPPAWIEEFDLLKNPFVLALALSGKIGVSTGFHTR